MSAAAQPVRQAHDRRVARAVPAPVTLVGWALLVMDGITIALPQRDVVTIELTSALQPAQEIDPDGGGEIGWLARDTQRWPVYCLDRHLRLAPALADTARVCVLFRSDERTLGVAGTQVSLLAADADLAVPSLPACLTRSGSPLTGLALHRDTIVAIVRAQSFEHYLLTLETA